MKRILIVLSAALLLFLLSCNSADDNKSETAAAVKSAPFKIIMIEHPVADFNAWKTAYLAHDSTRKAFGIIHYMIGRGTDDPTMVLVIDKINDISKAKEFAASADLMNAMEKAGVMGMPTITYAEVVRNDDTPIEQKDRVMISHRVKDFDTWLKVYDAEGVDKRREFGIIDRGLARSIDDPNLVYIVFAITDKPKATARMNSEELKKTMMEGGVEGEPQAMYFRIEE